MASVCSSLPLAAPRAVGMARRGARASAVPPVASPTPVGFDFDFRHGVAGAEARRCARAAPSPRRRLRARRLRLPRMGKARVGDVDQRRRAPGVGDRAPALRAAGAAAQRGHRAGCLLGRRCAPLRDPGDSSEREFGRFRSTHQRPKAARSTGRMRGAGPRRLPHRLLHRRLLRRARQHRRRRQDRQSRFRQRLHLPKSAPR